MANSFSWYELLSPDPSASKIFYNGVLGWTTEEMPMGASNYTVVKAGDLAVGGILDSAATGTHQPMWLGYISVEDLADASKRLTAAGGKILREAAEIPNVGRFSVVADAQGGPFILFQPKAGMVPPPDTPGAPGTPAWHDYAGIDGATAFDFYAGLFGWTKSDAMDMGPAGVYQIFAAGAGPTGGMMTRMNPNQPPGWLFYFHVEDTHAAIERAKQHGGTIVHGPSEVPGGQIIAHCVDPQGAIFGMVNPMASH